MQRRLALWALVVGVAGTALLAAPQAPRLARAAAETVGLPWWTLSAGGGASAGPTYSLSGTFGQHGAGSGTLGMSGGTYALAVGFWPGAATPRYTVHLPLVLRE